MYSNLNLFNARSVATEFIQDMLDNVSLADVLEWASVHDIHIDPMNEDVVYDNIINYDLQGDA